MAGTTVGKLNALLTADTSQFATQLTGASGMVGNFAQSLLGGLGVGFSVGGVVAGIQQAIAAAEESYQIQQKLDSVLSATGNAAGFSAAQLTDYASQLSRLTAIDDEAIVSAEALLAMFTNIKGDQFTRTIALAADLSSVMGTDVSSAAQTLGKALANPEDAMGKLARIGIVLDEQQRQTIQSMLELNDTAGAQGVILDALEGKVGGAAERMRSAWKGVSVEWDNLIESLGRLGSTEGGGGGLANLTAQWLHFQSTMTDDLSKLTSALIQVPQDLFHAFAPDALQKRLASIMDMGKLQAPVPNLAENLAPKLTAEQVAAIEDMSDALRKQIATFGMSKDAIKLWDLENEGIPSTELENVRALMQKSDALTENARAVKSLEDMQRSLQSSINSTIKSLEEQSATLGMSSEQIQIWKMQQQGANEVELGWGKQLVESNTYMRDMIEQWSTLSSTSPTAQLEEAAADMAALQDALDAGTVSGEAFQTASEKLGKALETSFEAAGKAIHEAVKTPLEKAQDEIRNLNALLEGGFISLEDYERRVQEVAENVQDTLGDTTLSPAALEFGTAAAFSATGPTNIESKNEFKDRETHQRLDAVKNLLDDIRRAIADNEPVFIGSA